MIKEHILIKKKLFLFCFRECFFTMKDAKSTAKFIQVLNESLESGALMCQLYNAELNKYIMNLTNNFCRDQVDREVDKVYYIKKAAVCLGLQPDSSVWVLNKDVHLDSFGNRISPDRSEYIWLGSIVGKRNLPNVAPTFDAASIPLQISPSEAINQTLSALKSAVRNNFTPAFTLIASVGMSMHYECIMKMYGMCPTPVGIGKKNTGKSTAAKTALALIGTPQFFVRDFTPAQTAALSSRKTFPTVFDDPDDVGKVKSMIDNCFNAGARSTSRSTSVSRSVGIVTLNLDKLKSLCSNYK